MFYKLGLNTFYGPNGLNDLAELGPSLLPYTKDALMHYFNGFNDYKITSSKFWYEERTDFSEKSLNIPCVMHNELNDLLQEGVDPYYKSNLMLLSQIRKVQDFKFHFVPLFLMNCNRSMFNVILCYFLIDNFKKLNEIKLKIIR